MSLMLFACVVGCVRAKSGWEAFRSDNRDVSEVKDVGRLGRSATIGEKDGDESERCRSSRTMTGFRLDPYLFLFGGRCLYGVESSGTLS
jgi:hypothetical protein